MNLRQPILDLAVDDFTGLWEIIWRARSLAPDRPDAELRTAALNDTRDLVRAGLLAVYRGTRFNGDEVQLSMDEALGVLSAEDSWAPSEVDAVHLRVAATEAGATAYQQTPNAEQ